MTEPGSDRSLSEALQEVLLPRGLPDVDGWAIATLYEPAGEAVLVGGDFYDWFTLPNGNVLFFIGDVSGKGPLAGALAMSIRKALKGLAWAVSDPFEALSVLEKALSTEFADNFATLCLLELKPSSGKVRLLLAGHPAPWIRRRGVFSEVTAPANSLLGPALQQQWTTAELQLESGEVLVVFTDGVAEARLPDGRLFGEGPLKAFLDSLPTTMSSYDLVLQADSHLRRTAAAFRDDVIIGALSYRAAPAVPAVPAPEGAAIHLSPDSRSAGSARRFVRATCSSWRLPEEVVNLAMLAVSELVSNALLHARSALDVHLELSEHRLRVAVHDQFDRLPELPELPAKNLPIDSALERDHGRGLSMLQRLGAQLGTRLLPEGGKSVWADIWHPQ